MHTVWLMSFVELANHHILLRSWQVDRCARISRDVLGGGSVGVVAHGRVNVRESFSVHLSPYGPIRKPGISNSLGMISSLYSHEPISPMWCHSGCHLGVEGSRGEGGRQPPLIISLLTITNHVFVVRLVLHNTRVPVRTRHAEVSEMCMPGMRAAWSAHLQLRCILACFA